MKKEIEDMETQILEAAEKLFLERGYSKTTTGQIAELAGCNQALVHYYYRTKDNLFDKVFEEKFRLMASNLMAADSTETSIESKIIKMVESYFDFLKQNPRLPLFVLSELSSNPEKHTTLINKLKQFPIAIVNQFDKDLKIEIEKGSIRPISAIDLVFTIASLNITPFLISPLLNEAFSPSEEYMQEALEGRKQETIRTVLARLRL